MLKKFFFLTGAMFGLSFTSEAFAQDYPYEDQDAQTNAASLPVEAPGTSPTQRTAPQSRPTSLFRMGLKAGANFTSLQDAPCIDASSSSGCIEVLDRKFNSPGIEGRISLGWDLAYQPIYLETELGYQHKLMNTDSPLRIIQIQQGLFHRERIGKKSLWKNGLLTTIDIRIYEGLDEELTYSVQPSIGFASMIEWGAFVTQINFYLNQFQSQKNYWSLSFLVGVRF